MNVTAKTQDIERNKGRKSMKMFKIAARPQLDFHDLQKIPDVAAFILENNIDNEILEQTEVHVKYAWF